jgi:outer membrane receptor protein involved in Fe transport
METSWTLGDAVGRGEGRRAANPLGRASSALVVLHLVIAMTCAARASSPVTQSATIEVVTVTAMRLHLTRTAATASEGVVDDRELQLTPAYRPGQMLETVPGLIATLHSGEGKANQYLMRGYNLDHGTDLATTVDDMPVNQPTHAHGQGYTDLNFLIPELADEITFTKGPYYADVGDFGAVGSVHIAYRDTIADEAAVTLGTFGFERLFAAGSQPTGDGNLLEAAEIQHYDGPFVNPDDARKVNAVLRYSDGREDRGFSLTGMIYHQLWTNTTDIPLRAIDEGTVPNRFGTLDPSDGGIAQRESVSAEYHAKEDGEEFSANLFYIFNQLHLFNDFTHFLVDPVHGDQEDQFENRNVMGGGARETRAVSWGGIDSELLAGVQTRDDMLTVGRQPSEGERPLPLQDVTGDPASYSDDDRVNLFAAAAWLQATTHWTQSFRSIFGIRDDVQSGTDTDLLARLHETAGYTNGGAKSQSLVQPKGSLVYTPADSLELYLSAGEGFHSADLRGVDQDRSVNLGLPGTPLLARQVGEEIGARAVIAPNLAITLAAYNLWQQSETIIDPDVGQDVAGPPSGRTGFEINTTWQIRRWLELYASYSGDHTRFTRPFDDGTGHLGTYITDAPSATGSLALYLENLGPWSGGLEYRYLGNYPLSSGPCVDSAAVHDFPGVATSCANAPTAQGQINGKGFGQLNVDGRYTLESGWSASLGIYNLLDTRAAAAEFWYVDRLKSEIASYPDGRADVHLHPLEPLMLRFSISKYFG